ncbi:Rieske (2Fe-2S) protein [Pseudonocardia sp.]|jgi:nitrite reductase/ring-hydroxylating ferredoxin subunit|uniref:Rieske (2Fe-2S) protein n=1 Tax=Pseudonocardia sp. TaxID=60912 RepID=UPI003D0C36D4
MAEVALCLADDVPPAEMRVFDVGNVSVVVVNVGGQFVGLRNWCPHHGAPIGRGRVERTLVPSAPHDLELGRDFQVLVCPWHRWEFNMTTLQCLADPRFTLRSIPVRLYEGRLYAQLVEDGTGRSDDDPGRRGHVEQTGH